MVESSGKPELFADMVSKLDLKPPIVIKPNWGFSICYTEAKILDWVLSALKSKALVVESYGWARTEDALLRKGVGSKTRSALRKSDKWFLDHSGIGEILKKHGVEFLNMTEEVWAGRTAKPRLIKELVEAKYPPAKSKELYAAVPLRLYELRGGTLLSLAKIRIGAPPIDISFSVKNLFGMIPNPSRMKYHGKKNALLDQSILDINKIYRALFNVKGIVEGIFTASDMGDKPLDPVIHKNLELFLGCEDTVELDAFTTALVKKNPYQVGHLKLAAELFGRWNDQNVALVAKSNIHVF